MREDRGRAKQEVCCNKQCSLHARMGHGILITLECLKSTSKQQHKLAQVALARFFSLMRSCMHVGMG